MSKINVFDFSVRYPDKEKAYAFVTDSGSPFINAVIGITNPHPDYKITRSKAYPVNVLECVLEGEGEVYLNGKWQMVRAGDIYILRAGEEHQYRANPRNPWKKIWINYVADYISTFFDAYGIKSGIYSAEGARVYFEQAFEYASCGMSYSDIGYNIAKCVHDIVNCVAIEKNSESSDEYRIREALGGAVYEKVGLDEISARLHMSKSNVIRIFKKKYGVTPYEYLISLKIATAKILLKDTQMTVKEIAQRLCFSDEHYFSNIFFARVGARPKEYRQRRTYNMN